MTEVGDIIIAWEQYTNHNLMVKTYLCKKKERSQFNFYTLQIGFCSLEINNKCIYMFFFFFLILFY